MALGTAYGFRNAQVTVIAPTGTIGLVMDCDTTGIEPDFALVKFKTGGRRLLQIINQVCRRRCRRSGIRARSGTSWPIARAIKLERRAVHQP